MTASTIGYIRWMWDKFSDPQHLLRPGQPTQLNDPTDALYWQEWEGGNLVQHCLVADSGNHRILDLVYRFATDTNGNPTWLLAMNMADTQPDPASGFYIPELNWVTATDSVNERYVYQLHPARP